MKPVTLTCPFTGVSFDATEFTDGTIIAYNPLTGEEIRMTYNYSNKRYNLKRATFREIPTVSQSEASEILGTSRQYINKLVKNGKLHACTLPNGDVRIAKADIIKLVNTKEG